mmetsp:Transcript_43905/g.115949  ORF Transcript_43905/g.115949 Transcript_43905/m.115949 type:complete len:735 (-) Transcript_43905:747-2951(-)
MVTPLHSALLWACLLSAGSGLPSLQRAAKRSSQPPGTGGFEATDGGDSTSHTVSAASSTGFSAVQSYKDVHAERSSIARELFRALGEVSVDASAGSVHLEKPGPSASADASAGSIHLETPVATVSSGASAGSTHLEKQAAADAAVEIRADKATTKAGVVIAESATAIPKMALSSSVKQGIVSAAANASHTIVAAPAATSAPSTAAASSEVDASLVRLAANSSNAAQALHPPSKLPRGGNSSERPFASLARLEDKTGPFAKVVEEERHADRAAAGHSVGTVHSASTGVDGDRVRRPRIEMSSKTEALETPPPEAPAATAAAAIVTNERQQPGRTDADGTGASADAEQQLSPKGAMARSTSTTDLQQGSFAMLFGSRHGIALCLVVVALASIFGNACLAIGLCLYSAVWQRKKISAMRRFVEQMPVCKSSEIDMRLPTAGGYDCAFSKPLSSKMLLRLEACVQRPVAGSQLTAPLTKKTCVLYSSAVSKQLHDGVHPVPIAFACASVNFSVALVDSPGVTIDIKGSDVSLFDMSGGRYLERRSFERVPDDWQDFISSHRTSPHLSATLRSDGAALEFQECTLCVGAIVTLVGELHRDANGRLSMRPWLGDGCKDSCGIKQPRERWRTSWEDWSCVDATTVAADSIADSGIAAAQGAFGLSPSASRGVAEDDFAAPEDEADLRSDKVLISDNPELCRSGNPTSRRCWASQLCNLLQLRLGYCRALTAKKMKAGQRDV